MSPTETAQRLRAAIEHVAQETTDRHFAAHPALEARWGPAGRATCTDDARRHLEYLATAIETEQPALFTEYIQWTASVLDGVGVPSGELKAHLRTMLDVLETVLQGGAQDVIPVATPALDALDAPPEEPAPFAGHGPYGELAQRYLEVVLAGDRHGVVATVTDAVESGVPIEALYLEVFQPVLRDIGRLWQRNRISVAQEHFATAATQLAMSTLYPRIFADRGPVVGNLLATCVGGELHEVGVRMLADIFELRGWDTHFIGANVPARDLVAAASSRPVDLIAVSATLPTHIDRVAGTIEALRSGGVTAPIVVGGRAFLNHPSLVEHVGADGTAPDAVTALELARSLVGPRP